MVVVLVGAGALGFWVMKKPSPIPLPTQPTRPAPVDHHSSANKNNRVKIFVAKIINDDARLVPEERTIRADIDPHKGAIEELLATNQETTGQAQLIPQGTKLLELTVKNGIAYVDFSREFKDNFPGGSMNEALLINSIVHTLTQFEDVGKVQILVEGEKIESLGDLDISEPIAGSSTLLGTNGDQE
jgi:spore germination protein GerM